MSEWIPMFALPNLQMPASFGTEIIVLTSAHDHRIKQMMEEYPNFVTFMSNFRTEFGDLVEPAIIIVKADAPPSYRTVEAVAGFRDAVAITAVSRAWALAIRYGTSRSTLYANWFSIYPWMLDKNFDDVITRTMAVLAIHDVKRLKPQSSAAVSPQWLEPQNIDFTLSQELLKRWTKRYADDTADKPDTALFRSLNMAHYAALMPAGADVTMYDIGRTVALWVSAFEILAHPGDDTKNGFSPTSRRQRRRGFCKMGIRSTGLW